MFETQLNAALAFKFVEKYLEDKHVQASSKKKINTGWWCEGDKQIWKEAKVFALNEVARNALTGDTSKCSLI